MAWCFGLYGFLDAEATTAERVRDLAEAIAVSGHRISVNVDYAVSQKNNHGISEAVGLFTIGSLFPEFTGSGYWRAQGRRLLDRQALELFYEDGAFAQHSLNYQRLALHDYLWAARIAETRGEPFDANVLDRLYRSAMMLYQLQDAETGQVPCYGHNDGALVLPLNNCDYNDYRPITQAVTYLCSRTRLHSAGKWDEDLLWLFGPDAPAARHKPLDRTDFSAEHGGYYTVRSPEGFTFVRCARFRHRPGQADLLHVDLWWRGLNIARDPGSYSYNAPAPWNGSLAGTAFHNTVTVDGRDQMDLVSRFLWLPWANGRVHHPPGDGGPTASYWEGSHDGYLRLPYQVTHRRCLLHFGDETWAVVDCLTGRTRHSYRLHWLLGDYPFFWKESSGSVLLHTPAGDYSVQTGCSGEATAPSLIRADEHGPRGWISPYYHDRKPALSLDRTSMGTSVWFWTLLGPAGFCVDYNGAHSLSVTREGWRRNLAFTEGADLSIPLIAVVSD
jgi:asparagine synthase (glutamine-hydrolysing)